MSSTSKISKEYHHVLQGIRDLYIEENHVYIIIYRVNDLTHLLPVIVPDRIFLREIAYQTSIKGFPGSLTTSSKRAWPTFPTRVENMLCRLCLMLKYKINI